MQTRSNCSESTYGTRQGGRIPQEGMEKYYGPFEEVNRESGAWS